MPTIAYVRQDSVPAISPHDICWMFLLTDRRLFRVDIPKRIGMSPYEIHTAMQRALDNGYPLDDSFMIPAKQER